jgi:hypothetical protein
VRSTIQRLGSTTKVLVSDRLTISTVMPRLKEAPELFE